MTAAAARGWHRPTSGTLEERAALLKRARELGEQTEAARQRMLELAGQRQDTVLAAYDAGTSVRELAAELGVSIGVIQEQLRQARRRQAAS